MSNVKENVIRIVNGLPPLEPKTVVELSPDEFVATKTQAEALQVLVDLGTHNPDGTLTADYQPDEPSSLSPDIYEAPEPNAEEMTESYRDRLIRILRQPTPEPMDDAGGFCGFGPEAKKFFDEIETAVELSKSPAPKPFIKFKMVSPVAIWPRDPEVVCRYRPSFTPVIVL